MRKQTARWKMKDGTTVRICDMDDKHLANAIALLERFAKRCDRQFAMAPNPFHGDIAFEIMESKQNAILEGDAATDPSDLCPMYDKLCAELARRGAISGCAH